MYIFSVRWDLIALWKVLALTAKLYVFLLLVFFVSSVYALLRELAGARSYQKTSLAVEGELRKPFLKIARSIENVRQLSLFFLLLFGLTLANEVFATLRSIRESALSLSARGVEIFEPCAAFSFVVFVVLTLLHVFQWTATVRLRQSIAA